MRACGIEKADCDARGVLVSAAMTKMTGAKVAVENPVYCTAWTCYT